MYDGQAEILLLSALADKIKGRTKKGQMLQTCRGLLRQEYA